MISTARFALADSREAADLGAFLSRLLRFDRAAAVRLQLVVDEASGAGVLAVYGRLPLGSAGVLALRTSRLEAGTAMPAGGADLTVSAGQLLEGVDEAQGALAVPPPVTGPAWAGLLPPRGGWQSLGAVGAELVVPQVMAAVAEFKERTAQVPEHHRTREVLDRIADEIWSRPLSALPALPLRAAHAAYRIGFLHPGAPLTAHRAGGWLRLTAPHGTVALRATAAPGAGLGLTPLS
ncbi:hypothetical protein [Kitasatospora kifunensis]|uniref:Uncharacterized protein n=1 Tax=Kitasatospora kifunensis TaxID=58351 RepID=A0A7W7VXL7_KITKI|nr:hypothetical protein [Kitasatospora kifunensis]MBB4925740.1 hypothetical protein [Kitasatospora kifunensis]